jgi:hypothetical protein
MGSSGGFGSSLFGAAASFFGGGANGASSGLAALIGAASGTPTTGDYNSLGAIAGARAGGGGVNADAAYLVGENGPELFTPSANGSIASSSMTQRPLSGAGGMSFDFSGMHIGDGVSANAVRQAMNEAVAQAQASVLGTLQRNPNIVRRLVTA